jgi:hypothetical protein
VRASTPETVEGVVLVQKKLTSPPPWAITIWSPVVPECGRHLGAEHRVIAAVERDALDKLEPPVARETKCSKKSRFVPSTR